MCERGARKFGGRPVSGDGSVRGKENRDAGYPIVEIGAERRELERLRVTHPVETDPGRRTAATDSVLGQFGRDTIGDQSAYLQEGMECMLSLHEGVPIAIELPQRVTLEVVETEPVVKGQTASSSYKPAVLSNGVRTMVPPHVGAGTKIVVMTEDGSYVERAKD